MSRMIWSAQALSAACGGRSYNTEAQRPWASREVKAIEEGVQQLGVGVI